MSSVDEVGMTDVAAVGAESIKPSRSQIADSPTGDYPFLLVLLVGVGLGLATWLITPGWSALVGLGFLGFLIVLAWKARGAAQRLTAELDRDQSGCLRWEQDAHAVSQLVKAVKRYREQGLPTGDAALAGGTSSRDREPGLLADAMSAELHHGYLAGDLADAGRLEPLLRQRAEPFFAALDGLQTTAFMVGLLGTVAGLLVQVFIAHGNGSEAIFSGGFLNGAVLAASTTVQGIVTALYVRHRAAGLGDRTNALIEDLVALYRRVFLPRLGGTGSDIERLAERIGERMRSQLQDFLSTLTQTLDWFLRGLPKEVQVALASALADSLTEPMELITKNLTAQVGLVRDAIKDSELAIKQGVRDLQVQVERLVGHPQETSRHLEKTLEQAISMEPKFEAIVLQLQGMTDALQAVGDQLVAQPAAGAVGGDQARADLEQMIQANLQELDQIGEAIRALSGLIGTLGAFDTTMEEQKRRIAEATAAVAAQQGALEANHASLDRLGSRIEELEHRAANSGTSLEGAPRSWSWRQFWRRVPRG